MFVEAHPEDMNSTISEVAMSGAMTEHGNDPKWVPPPVTQ